MRLFRLKRVCDCAAPTLVAALIAARLCQRLDQPGSAAANEAQSVFTQGPERSDKVTGYPEAVRRLKGYNMLPSFAT